MAEISVIMPVYNAAPYLRKAIDSILHQTFTDFELILINDCSKDDSEAIIQSYTDKRMRYVKLPVNRGVVGASNEGIALAKAPYTCVMHSDDIAQPERLHKQKAWLDARSKTAAVASFITFINEQDEITGVWDIDRNAVSAKSIRNLMLWENCIAHPTVMIRTGVYQKYGYRQCQQAQEDYDLWMRMLADGLIIEKIPEALLHYRRHQTSITGTILRKANPFFKKMDCKKKFMAHQLQQKTWGLFESQVLLTAVADGIMGIGKNIKKRVTQ